MLATLLGALLPFLGDALKRFIPDAGARAEAQEAITKALVENQSAVLAAMAEVMKSDAASDSWLTRSTRPVVVIWGLVMVSFVGVVAPAVGIQQEVVDGLAGIPSELWTLVTVGVGIFSAGRSIEKALGK